MANKHLKINSPSSVTGEMYKKIFFLSRFKKFKVSFYILCFLVRMPKINKYKYLPATFQNLLGEGTEWEVGVCRYKLYIWNG